MHTISSSWADSPLPLPEKSSDPEDNSNIATDTHIPPFWQGFGLQRLTVLVVCVAVVTVAVVSVSVVTVDVALVVTVSVARVVVVVVD